MKLKRTLRMLLICASGGSLFWMGANSAPIPPGYYRIPPGTVYGAADITLDGGKTRQYRLVVIGNADHLPYTVPVTKAKYDRLTSNLGQTWDDRP